MKIASIFTILCFAGAALAQPPDTLWTRTCGGPYQDRAYSVLQTSDGGFVLAGHTVSFGAGSYDCYLVKLNSEGDTLWTRTQGGSQWDEARSVQQAPDGGYVMVGWTESFGVAYSDFYQVWTNSQGYAIAHNFYTGPDFDRAYSFDQTTDGGYALAGFTFSYGAGLDDFYLVKANSEGSTNWTHTYGGSNMDECYAMQQTADGGYVLAGFTYSYGAGEADYYLVKTNSQGDTLWTRTYGGQYQDFAYCVQQTTDSGYVVAGSAQSFSTGGTCDIYLVKTNSQGDTLWTRTYGGLADESAYSVDHATNGGYILAGMTTSYGAGQSDFYLVKITSQGDTVWTATYGGSQAECAYSIQQIGGGGYIAAGETQSFGAGSTDCYVVRIEERHIYVTNPNGGEEWHMLQQDTVRWHGYGFDGDVSIEINHNFPSGTWEVLVENTVNDGEEVVLVTGPPSDHCRIKVRALQDTLSDASDADFSIVSSQGYLSLVRPSQPSVSVLSWSAGTLECPAVAVDTFRLKNFGSESLRAYQPLEPASVHFSRLTSCPVYIDLAPGEMSTCEVALTFDPLSDGSFFDTLLIQSDAANQQGGYVRTPLSGTQISTPAPPELVLSIEGEDSRISWNPVTESIGECEIEVLRYLLFFSEDFDGPYWYLTYTADTTFLHVGAVSYAADMYYQGLSTLEQPSRIESLTEGRTVTYDEVLAALKQ
ncbi:MAG: hypothetical protein KJ626_09545 [Verrucomicrobia bacterium]|nr:hypothetical protein [Verrucomicrobiota bacterium]